jgi:hypothetical protein
MPIGFQIGSLCFLAAGLATLAVWVIRRKSSTPEKREQRRRLTLHVTGRLGDALITEGNEENLFYTYTVRGVQYAASQNITSLRSLLPSEPERLIGMAGMKYSTRNPADSMLLCEEWSGLRNGPAGVASVNDNTIGHHPQNATLTEGA